MDTFFSSHFYISLILTLNFHFKKNNKVVTILRMFTLSNFFFYLCFFHPCRSVIHNSRLFTQHPFSKPLPLLTNLIITFALCSCLFVILLFCLFVKVLFYRFIVLYFLCTLVNASCFNWTVWINHTCPNRQKCESTPRRN